MELLAKEPGLVEPWVQRLLHHKLNLTFLCKRPRSPTHDETILLHVSVVGMNMCW